MCLKKRNNGRLQQHLSCSKFRVYFSILKTYLPANRGANLNYL